MHLKLLVWPLLATTLSIASFLSSAATVAGSTPGEFSVTDSGAASYRVPIRVPPGIAGIEPKLELVYNSQGPNSFLGQGWGLSGLSAISRCRRTIGSDGVNGIVELKNTDRFCMDGQRLLLTAGSAYGAASSQYRTERESFAEVTAIGGDNSSGTSYSGPSSFTVKTKAGLVLEFGGTVDARIEAPTKPAVVTWALNKVTDTKGNYMTVTYSEDTANGTFYPNRIDYTGNGPAGKATGN